MKLEGKVALVTGGAEGIGKSASKELLENGSSVCICDIDKSNGEKTLTQFIPLYGEDKVMFMECDVTDHHKFSDVFCKTLERFGQIDIVVNNAGLAKERDDWRNTVNVNLIGTIEGCKNADTYMSLLNGGKGGVVVNIASLGGLVPLPSCPVYGATKAGVISFTKSYASRAEEMKSGLRFLCICPGVVNAGMGKLFLKKEENTDSHQEIKASYDNDPSRVLSVEFLVSGIVKVIEQENNNGGVITVTNTEGFKYIHGEPESDKK